MYIYDMEFNGKKLSERSYIICKFDNTEDVVTSVPITFNIAFYNQGTKGNLTSAVYDTGFECSFDICLDPNKYSAEYAQTYNDNQLGTIIDRRIISYAEYGNLLKWLNRRGFKPIKLYCRDEYDNTVIINYNGSFNLSPLKYNRSTYAVRLVMKTDSPYGTLDKKSVKENLLQDETMDINYFSDEIGFITPDMIIKCNADGTVKFINELNGSTIEIRNCVQDEIITVSGGGMFLESTNKQHMLYNDFNYSFLKIGQTDETKKNTIKCLGIPTELTISYRPIVKTF